jgi:hypothetical protein
MIPLHWVTCSQSDKLMATTPRGLYTICRGGDRRRQFVLRYLPLHSGEEPAMVLGIHSRPVDAQDEAERHNRSHSNGHTSIHPHSEE